VVIGFCREAGYLEWNVEVQLLAGEQENMEANVARDIQVAALSLDIVVQNE